jgi:hypothetical protein
MTHSLHRRGTEESLANDYVILITPAIGINDKGSGEKLKRTLRILRDEGVTNIGDVEHGSILGDLDWDSLESYMGDGKRIRASISNEETLTRILRRFKEQEIGLSVTVSGLIKKIYNTSEEAGLKPNTINMSLGILGKTTLLPSEEVLQVTTMCGHHMISQYLVEDLFSKIRSGVISSEKAVDTIGRLCVCGIFNQERCKDIFDENL